MKTRITGILLGFIFVGWGLPQAPAFFANTTKPITVSIALPAASLDLSDLDVRDALNRPVHSLEKHDELSSLFTSSLNSLLMRNFTPSARAQQEILSRIWNIISGTIRDAVRKFFETLSGFLPQKRFHFSLSVLRAALFCFWFFPVVRLTYGENKRQQFLSSILSSTILLR